MKHTDSRFWWEDLFEAREALGEVCSIGWRGIKGMPIVPLYDRCEPDGLFLLYYTSLAAIQDYVSSAHFQYKYEKSIKELKGSKGGPQ